jgi:hypothetical protein
VREADYLVTFMCRMSWKSGSLNLLETSGPHQAFYGKPLPLPCNVGTIRTNLNAFVRFLSREIGPDRTGPDRRSVGSHMTTSVDCTVTDFDCPSGNKIPFINIILYRQSRIDPQHVARHSQPPCINREADRQTDITVTRYMINAFAI